MKPHLIIKTRSPLPQVSAIPYWRDFIRDKSRVVTSLSQRFDALLREYALEFWVTQEHVPAHSQWSADELSAGLSRIYRVILQRDYETPTLLIERIRQLPEVESAFPLEVVDAPLPTPILAQAQDVGTLDNSRELIGLRHAHLFTRGHRDIKVAVLDTGMCLDHPELADRICGRADFVNLEGLDTREFIGDVRDYDDVPEDEVGHGTHVGGIIAGAGLNMPQGVAPNCSLIVVRVLACMRAGERKVGAGIPDNINAGIKWAVDQGAHVINMSLGLKQSGGGLPHEDVIRYAQARGVTIVAASGNDGTQEKYYPGALPGVIAVGATDRAGVVTPFTSFGAPVWILAPGSQVFSSFADRSYAFSTGTSQASPFVAGAAALLRSLALERGARLSDAELKDIFLHTSDKPDHRMQSSRTGCGRLNLLDACRLLSYRLGSGSARSARPPVARSTPFAATPG